MEEPFAKLTANEFRRVVAQREHVPMTSIELVGYDLTEFNFVY